MKWSLNKTNGYLMTGTWNPVTKQLRTVYQHRLIWEIYRGPIPKGGVIHHKNGCRTDNRIENLELMASHNAHRTWHHDKAKALGVVGVVKSCACCQHEFVASMSRKKYCSKHCKDIAAGIRWRTKHPDYAAARYQAKKRAA